MVRLSRILYCWGPWAIPVGLCILGWRFGGWLGMAGGAIVGLLLAVVAWVGVYYLALSHRLRRRRVAVSKLSTGALNEIVADPTSRELGLAMEELQSRGIQARPSIESLCSLLLAANSNRRGLAMSLFHATYPKLWARVAGDGHWSNMDPPEVWEARVARIRAGG